MDELERRMRDSLTRAVDGWEPTADGVRRAAPVASRRPLMMAMASVAVLVLAAGGIGIALGVTGSHGTPKPATLAAGSPAPSDTASTATACPGLQFLSEAQFASAAPIGCPVVSSACPTSLAQPPTVDPGSPYSSSICLQPDPPSPTASARGSEVVAPVHTLPPTRPVPSAAPTAASATASPTPAVLPACTAKDFTVALTEDKPSYEEGEAITVNATVTATRDCVATRGDAIKGGFTDVTGTFVETFGYCPLHNGQSEKCPLSTTAGSRTWRAGNSDAVSDTWSGVETGQLGGGPSYGPNRAMAGTYTLSVTDGPASDSKPLTITAAPTCTADQLQPSVVPEYTSVARGGSAEFFATLEHNGDICRISFLTINQTKVTVTDSTGAVVWSGCVRQGLPQGGSCPAETQTVLTAVYVPGQGNVFPIVAADYWDLVKDGDATTGPTPLPDGTYEVNYTPYGYPGLTVQAPVTITG